MPENINKLVIIGNGFDLAHGFKTSYNDFILWLLNQRLTQQMKYEPYYEELFVITPDRRYVIETVSSVSDFLSRYKQETRYKSSFFESIINSSKEQNWVDIESEFYRLLITIYNDGQGQKELYRHEIYRSQIEKLNADFEFIKNKLEEYLSTLSFDIRKEKDINEDINDLFQRDFAVAYLKENQNQKRICYLNFNYTNTIESYIHQDTNHEINYIHGKLNIKENPLIFGYGDEVDSYYEKIENLNINEFLNNFKSFGYFKTKNYQNLLRFIDSEPYEIEILGHSCGLSDRVLLSTLFQHDNCQSIKIHYYQKSATEDDYTIKTQEISRHFHNKALMRKRIIDKKDCKSLVRFVPK